MTSTNTNDKAKSRTWTFGRINLLLIGVSGAASAHLSWTLYTAPIGSVRVAGVLFLALCSGLFYNRVLWVLQRNLLSDIGRVANVTAHTARWLLTLVLIQQTTALLHIATNAREQREIADILAPLARYADQFIADNGRAPDDLSEVLALRRTPLSFSYASIDDRYVIVVHGGSIDIDGTSVFFDSTSQSWSRVHNDALTSNSRHPPVIRWFKLTKDLPFKTYQ